MFGKKPSSSRFFLLNWLNDTLILPLTCIEQLGAGNVYCQLLDAAYPNTVPLQKVKWDAKWQTDFIHNFKILQECFDRLGIEKYIDVQKLVKIRYQDNLEFLLWMKGFVEGKIDYDLYEPLKRRNFVKIDLTFSKKKKFQLTLNTNKQNQQNMHNLLEKNVNEKLKLSRINHKKIPKPQHRKQHSTGPIPIQDVQKESKVDENKIIPCSSRHLRHRSVLLGNFSTIDSDHQRQQLF